MTPPANWESLLPAEEALRSRWLNDVLDILSDGLAIVDAEGRILYANPAFARLTGCLAEQLAGSAVDEVAPGLHAREVLRAGGPAGAVVVLRESEGETGRREGAPPAERSGKTARPAAEAAWQTGELVYRSAAMQNLVGLALRLARVDSHVLITGESGVGKELFAQLVHRSSSRGGGPLVVINCGAIPEPLLESELLGYESGAFTGAKAGGKQGLLELADGGVLLLDEVAELPLALQVKLLRVLQEQQFRRVGGTRLVKVNVRVLAATNKNLKELVAQKLFREDLYYRLNVTALAIPPLREHREDIEPLTWHYLDHYNARYRLRKSLHPAVLRLFRAYSWPGNVRELQHLVERLVVSSPTDRITPEDQVLRDYFGERREEQVTISGLLPLKEAQELLERRLITEAIQRQGSIRKAAPQLGIDHSTLVRKMKKYGLEPETGTA